MKRNLAILLRIVLFIAVTAIILTCAVKLLRRKDGNYKYGDFFEQAAENNIDVLFIGSSHVINAINPVVLYRDYGYTSYNMGGHGALLQSSYWELREALNYCAPQYVVVDTYMLEKDVRFLDDREGYDDDDELNTAIEQLHQNMDVWPLDGLKVEAVNDLIKDPRNKCQFLFDFMIYHNRWHKLEAQDFRALSRNPEKNDLFGAESRYVVKIDPPEYPDPTEDQLIEDTVGTQYLEKIIEECDQRDIGVIVTYYPFVAETKDKAAAIRAGEIAAEYDVTYDNMLGSDVIDIYTDLNDHGHLNATGAEKVTDYVGQLLKDTGDLTDHRGDMRYSYWQKKVKDYRDQINDFTLKTDNLYSELNLLSLVDYSYIFYLEEDSRVFSDKGMTRIIEKLSGTPKINRSGSGPYILINDNSTVVTVEASKKEALSEVFTTLGNLNYQPVEKKFRLLYPSDNDELNYLYDDEHHEYDIQLIIYDENGEVVKHDYYRSNGGNYER
ncbi:MAG: hypothetical protein K6G10_09095 [Butyrivibrio sp.]|nr:hypothetical protein [Butyrivibrio sp.]